jgi:hypothetical protein
MNHKHHAGHRTAFEALTSGDYANFALVSCFVNGEPAAPICAVNRQAIAASLAPLFVRLTPSLELTGLDGRAPET